MENNCYYWRCLHLEIGYFLFFGLLHLSILTYQDIRHKCWVDDRHNWFMIGVVAVLYVTTSPPLYYGLILIAVSLALRWVINKKKILGEADVNTVAWSFIGFGVIGWNILLFYAVILVILYLLYVGGSIIIVKLKI